MSPAFYGNHGVAKHAERERRQREFIFCSCGAEVVKEMRTRGNQAGEWRVITLSGNTHKCRVKA